MAAPLLRAPDGIEPRIGWRVWNAVEDDGALRLGSLVYETIWPPALRFEARCRRPLALLPWARPPLHEPPNVDCCCGIYAVARADVAVHYLTARAEHGSRSSPRVLGRVSLWGRIVECDGGWRAAFGYPEHLYVPHRSRLAGLLPARPSGLAIARELEAYGVPVEVVEGIDSLGTDTLASAG